MIPEVVIADKIVILVPYTFRLIDHVTQGNEYAYDDCERKGGRDDDSQVGDFGFGCLWLHGVLYQFVNVSQENMTSRRKINKLFFIGIQCTMLLEVTIHGDY